MSVQDRGPSLTNPLIPEQPEARTAEWPVSSARGPALAVLRIVMGLTFLWAFLDKMFGLGYSTSSAQAWISGGSPTKGFLGHVQVGPMQSMLRDWAGAGWADWLFMLALLGLGVALLLGVALKPSRSSSSSTAGAKGAAGSHSVRPTRLGQCMETEDDQTAVEVERDQLRDALDTQPVIEQAKGMFMLIRGWTAGKAFAALMEISQHTNVGLHDVATVVVASASRAEPNLDDEAVVAAVLHEAKHLVLGHPFDRATWSERRQPGRPRRDRAPLPARASQCRA
ncbi:ANTAR domain-containing protein [Amycolatopsis sp. NPDC051758]|uniref:ANTAR domain-containing protein n=1 Tax=Amycolatopsis sp. NPDC051758 TaxID=3363935 RepID=UPI00378DABF2